MVIPILNLRCDFVCPSCVHISACLCKACRLENNRLHGQSKHKLNQCEPDSVDFELISSAITGTALKNLPYILEIQKIFRVESEEQGFLSSPNGSRLFFHGTSTDNAIGILQTGFQISSEERKFGQGCYFTPSSTTAAYYAALKSTNVCNVCTPFQYIFVCEIKDFKFSLPHQSYRPDQESLVDHYHGRITFNPNKSLFTREGVPISCELVPRIKQRTLETSLCVDEIVVRSEEFFRPVYLVKVRTIEYFGLTCKLCDRKNLKSQ